MLLSPLLCHHGLSKLVSQRDQEGPHTALLASPHGQVVASASRSYEEDEDPGESSTAGRQRKSGLNGEGENSEADVNGTDHTENEDERMNGGAEKEEEEGEGEGDDEPWLDEPERLRLLLGLASQWSEDDSPRIECEVSEDLPSRDLIDPISSPDAFILHQSFPPKTFTASALKLRSIRAELTRPSLDASSYVQSLYRLPRLLQAATLAYPPSAVPTFRISYWS